MKWYFLDLDVLFSKFEMYKMKEKNSKINLKLKGVFEKNERGYRLNAIKKRF